MPPELDDDHVVAICRVLTEHAVKYVIIGGVAARLHQTGHATVDIDICPAATEANLVRLAAALNDLGTKLRIEGDPSGVGFEAHADLLRKMTTMTLITTHGPLDLCFTPAGFSGGYDELLRHSVTVTVADVSLPIASLEDVVASKRAAGRPKDVVALPLLEARLRAGPSGDPRS